MAARIYLFNPQNDLALANGNDNFTAPRAAMDLASAGACLPIWYGNPGDRFIGAVNAQWFKEISDTFGLDVKPTMQVASSMKPDPWGWSAKTAKYLSNFGFITQLLPTREQIDRWRNISSRLYWTPILNELLTTYPELTVGHPMECQGVIADTLLQALDAVKNLSPAMIKLPWSNSGRGQQVSDRTTPEELPRRVAGMINRQGAVEVTPYYHRLLDFAMLWNEEGQFEGYSLFDTDSHGGWTGNILIPDEDIEGRINGAAGRAVDFKALQNWLTERIVHMKNQSGYPGPVGVDFIVGHRHDQYVAVVPVEVNLRRTMGHVAHRLTYRFLSSDSQGSFRIRPADDVPYPFARVSCAKITDGRLSAGSLDLVPSGGAFRFLFTAEQKD